MLSNRVMVALTTGGDADGDLAGTTFAGREIHSVIARDLVSTVYRATHPDDGRTVALRVVAADLCGGDGEDRQLYERFKRYASAALTLEHPNAPTVEEVGEHQGRGYVVTSDIDSLPFGAYLEQHGPLGMAAALPLFEQIADVLDTGQRAGVTHGAVNPLTLRIATPLRDEGVPTVYLTGHGLGALLGLRLRRDRGTLDVVDDLLYVAPEQLREQTSTGRTDQYAMACALVHAATGSPPFVRDTVNALFGAHLFVEPDDDATLGSRSAIHKGLAKEPRDRYATCGQLIADIQRAERSAVNRRRAATRRVALARQRPTSVTASDRPVPTVLYERGDVRHVGTRNDASPPQDADTAARDAAAGDVPGQPPVPATSPVLDDGPDDKSGTAVHDRPDLTYASRAQELAEGSETVEPEDDPAEALPLSEVLSRRSRRPRRAAWRRAGVLLALIIIAFVAVAAVLWFIGS